MLMVPVSTSCTAIFQRSVRVVVPTDGSCRRLPAARPRCRTKWRSERRGHQADRAQKHDHEQGLGLKADGFTRLGAQRLGPPRGRPVKLEGGMCLRQLFRRFRSYLAQRNRLGLRAAGSVALVVRSLLRLRGRHLGKKKRAKRNERRS